MEETLVHTLSRGVEKRIIFLDDQDRFRFIHDLFIFNDENWVTNSRIDIASRSPRKMLVDIHAFCLMSNHYHLLLSPRVEDGIPRFMKKLNMGFAKYFNAKYDRKGTLFEGRYKSVLVKEESHFIHLPYYIHLNPLDLIMPQWREREIHSHQKALNFLENYRWSSFPDYIGNKNFPSVTSQEFLLQYFNGTQQYKKDFTEWLQSIDLEEISPLLLE